MPLSPMESLYGAFGNPTSVDRQRLYSQQQDALRGSIGRAETTARADAARSAVSAGGGGNPYLAGRLGAQAGGQAAGQIQSQGIQQQAQLGAQQQAQEIAARQQQGQWAQHMLGGLIGAGGQVLGMAVPAFGALRGAAGATGMAQGLSGSGNPIGGMLGSALGGGQPAPQPPQAATPQVSIGSGGFQAQGMQAPPGMRWDPVTNQWVPATGGVGGP